MAASDGQLRDIWGCMLGIGAVAMLEADRRAGTSNGSAKVDGEALGRVQTSGVSEGDEDDEQKRNDRRPPTRRSWRSMLCFTCRATLVIASLAPATLAVALINPIVQSSGRRTIDEMWQYAVCAILAEASTSLAGVMIGSLWLFKKEDKPDKDRRDNGR